MLKIVFDTNVLISFALTPEAFVSGLIDMWDLNELNVFYSPETIEELRKVLAYSKFRSLISPAARNSLIQKLSLNGVLVRPRGEIKISRDLEDNKFLDVAMFVKADFLITWDKDLLILSKAGRTRILDPIDFMRVSGR